MRWRRLSLTERWSCEHCRSHLVASDAETLEWGVAEHRLECGLARWLFEQHGGPCWLVGVSGRRLVTYG